MLILLALLAGCDSGEGETQGKPGKPSTAPATKPKPATAKKPCDYPTGPGTYKSGEWEYTYTIRLKGTKSEQRKGKLKRNGKEVAGKRGQVLDTPLGRFLYFGKGGGWRSGWLNTGTYDTAIFNSAGRIRPAYFRALFLPDERKLQAMWKTAGGSGSYPRDNVLATPKGRVYIWGGTTLYAFGPERKPAWKRPTRLFINQVHVNGRGDVVMAEIGKGGGGTLWCLSADGKILWKQGKRVGRVRVNSHDQVIFVEYEKAQGMALNCLGPDGKALWRKANYGARLEGVDASDKILVRGEAKAFYSRLYSAEGKVLWERESKEPVPPLHKDKAGNYVVPGKPTSQTRS